MRRAFWLLLLLCLPSPSHAMWALVPLEELVQESDLIVVGTLRGVTEHTAGGIDYGRGHIEVREVIWGRVSPGDSLLLKWQNASDVVCPRVEHRGREGEEGVWLLTAEGGYVEANYPGRFVGLKERGAVERALARFPVALRSGEYSVQPGDPLSFTVVYRNFSDRARNFPAVEFADGRLRLSPGSRLAVEAELNGEQRQLRLTRSLIWDSGLAPVTVAARDERRVRVNLRDLLTSEPVLGESFDLRLALAGLRPTNKIGFYFNSPNFPELSAAPAAPARPQAGFVLSVAPARERGLPPHRRAMLTFVAAFSLYLWLKKFRAR